MTNTTILIEKPLSKKVRAQTIFETMTKDKHTRKEIIAKFMSDLDMSLAGGSTYHFNCKKIANGDTITTKKSTVKTVEVEVEDNRKVFTICTPTENELHEVVVKSTESHFTLEECLKLKHDSQIIVNDVPELDSNWSNLKPINKQCESII
jgi:hypothetical protein